MAQLLHVLRPAICYGHVSAQMNHILEHIFKISVLRHKYGQKRIDSVKQKKLIFMDFVCNLKL